MNETSGCSSARKGLAGLAAGVACLTCPAAEYYWDGATTVWDTTTAAWLLGNQPPAGAFVPGNVMKVTKGTGAASASAATKITFAQQVKPSEFVYDSSEDMTMDIRTSSVSGHADKPFAETQSFVKRGTGTLMVWKGENCDGELGLPSSTSVEVEEGALKFWARNSPVLALGGNTVHIHPGAEFWTCHYSSFGNPYSTAAQRLNIILGGALKLNDNGNSCTATEQIRSLSLEGGTITAVNQGAANYGVLGVCSDVYVTNRTAGTQTLTVAGTAANSRVTLDPVDPVTLHVDDVTGNKDDDLIFDTAHADTATQSLFNGDKRELKHAVTKVGAGTMRLTANNTPFNIRLFDIREGRFEFPRAQSSVPNTNYTVRVHPGATFCIPMRNTLSMGWQCGWLGEYAKPKYHILGGTFIVGDTAWDKTNGELGTSYLGDELILSNATFVANIGYQGTDGNWSALLFGRLLALDGETPYVFNHYTDRGWAFQSSQYGGTELRVADITGDDGVDATFNIRMYNNTEQDKYGPGKTGDQYAWKRRPSGFTKTGPGTVKFTHPYNGYSGSCEIREGTAIFQAERAGDLAGSVFGSVCTGLRMSVKAGATLVDEDANWGYYWTSLNNGEPVGNRFDSELMLDGGRLLLHNVKDAAKGQGVCWLYAKLAFKNGGTIEYDDPQGGNTFGQIAASGVRVEASDVAAVHEIPKNPLSDANQNFYLYQTNLVFDIADSSKDARADLTVSLNPKVFLAKTYEADGGFVKRGVGTLCFNGPAAASYITAPKGTVSVEEGCLFVNAAYGFHQLAGGVRVAASATVGGSGAVSGLTLAEGAGLESALAQRTPLTVAGSVTIPASGRFVLDVPAGMTDDELLESRGTRVLYAAGGLVGAENLSNWTVEVPGHESVASQFHLVVSNNRISCCGPRGTVIFIR